MPVTVDRNFRLGIPDISVDSDFHVNNYALPVVIAQAAFSKLPEFAPNLPLFKLELP
jgi:hypothetical protein